MQFLAEAGYIIASIDYTLSNQAAFPAPLDDAICAIRLGSAGAHLGLLLAMNNAEQIGSHYFSDAQTYSQTLFGNLLVPLDKQDFLIKANIPCVASEKLYEKACDKNLDHKINFQILNGAGHGSAEFFQTEIQDLILRHFEKYL